MDPNPENQKKLAELLGQLGDALQNQNKEIPTNMTEEQLQFFLKKQQLDDAKQQTSSLVKGMRQLNQKNIITDYQSKKMTWEQMNVPESVIHALEDLKMDRPSIIQATSIPKILAERNQDFLFQAMNGSGKTLSFGIPAILAVDPEIDAVQVIIVANTRELIRQVQQVIQVVSKNTKVTSCIGDVNTSDKLAHIVVTVPKWIENRISGRNKINLSHLKMMAYDEADEIFLQEYNHKIITKINDYLKKSNIKPQNVLFSATFTDPVIESINKFFDYVQAYRIQKEALKLKGVKMFRLRVEPFLKQETIKEVYEEFDMYQTMIFVNKKEEAKTLKNFLEQQGMKAEMLISGLDQKERDKIIDDFRMTVTNTLISTNVLARGIDVPEVDLVINYDVPYISDYGFKLPDCANFLHRVGRTGRFGTDGVSVTFYTDETFEDLLDQIEQYYDIKIEKIDTLSDLKLILKQMREKEAE